MVIEEESFGKRSRQWIFAHYSLTRTKERCAFVIGKREEGGIQLYDLWKYLFSCA